MNINLSSWWHRLLGNLLFLYLRTVTRTARWQVEGEEHLASARAGGRPLLWMIWHGQAMPLMNYIDRFGERNTFSLIMVGDKRFEVLSTLVERTRAGRAYPVDMNGSPVDAGRVVLKVVSEMRAGRQSVLAPDGPDGPPLQAKKGAAFLARKASAAILPVGAWTRHACRLRRWDRYLVPLPLARIHLVFGPPIQAGTDTDTGALLAAISEALSRVRSRARDLAGVKPRRGQA